MPFPVTDIVYGCLAPALVAGAVVWALHRKSLGAAGSRFGASAALAAGFFLGYRLLSLSPWMPEAHWQWLPYAVLLAAVVGPIVTAPRGSWPVRIGSCAIVAIAAAWFLVPAWEKLEPSRLVYLIGWVVYVTSLTALLSPLTSRFPGPLLPVVLAATLLAGGMVLFLADILRFAWIGVAGAGAMAGIATVAAFDKRTDAIAGVTLPFAVLLAGALLVGRLNSFSDVPWVSYLLVPLAPLLLWVGTRGRLSTLTGARRAVVCAVLPGLPLAIALLLAALGTRPITIS